MKYALQTFAVIATTMLAIVLSFYYAWPVLTQAAEGAHIMTALTATAFMAGVWGLSTYWGLTHLPQES